VLFIKYLDQQNVERDENAAAGSRGETIAYS
jgi:hypothetical protein